MIGPETKLPQRISMIIRALRQVAFTLYVPFGSLSAHAAPATVLETPIPLRASEVLPAHLLKGPYHSVEEQVTSDGYFNNYRLNSKFGVMEVEGQLLLETRVGELNALAELDRLSSSKVVKDAALKAGKGIVLAPVNITEKTLRTVSDPKKMADTLAGIPEGAERLFSWAYQQAKDGVKTIGEATGSKKSKRESSNSDDLASSTVEQAGKIGLEYVGYNKYQRDLYRQLHVSPYTSNELLRGEVRRVAGIQTTVKTAFKFVPGLGLLGELATFNRWYERAEKLSLYEEPGVIREKNRKALQNLSVPDELVARFLNNKAYSPWSRRFITASLSSLGPKIPGHTDFIRAACEATNESSTLYFVSVAETFENLHKISPLKRIVASLYLPAVITEDGTLYIPLPVDYLFWTDTVAEIFKDFKARVFKEASFTSAHMALRGRASPLATRSLSKLGFKVSEGSF